MYWLMQIVGWFLFILLILVQNLTSGPVDFGIWKFLVFNFSIGLGLSHSMRAVIIHFGMLRLKVAAVIVSVILLSVSAAVVATFILFLIQVYLFENTQTIPFSVGFFMSLFLPFMVVFLIWNILYFAASYLKNYEREEIKNLRLSASVTEVELMNLRTQLNPHFMFNALNSIRALIDENPGLAKKSITRMSGILRSSLTSGRHRLVPLGAEIKVVEDYLKLEKIRFEERLKYTFSIPENLLKIQIPPLLMQTIVENAVKHGIGGRPAGGIIHISAALSDHETLCLEVVNSGNYDPGQKRNEENTGIGLVNSRRRLKLLYGSRANIDISNTDEGVLCRISLPINIKNDSHEKLDY